MSLILEALKKLDREKQTPDRGLLVVGSVPWPARRTPWWRPALLAAALVAAGGTAAWLAWPRRGPEAAGGSAVTPATMAAATAPPAAGVAPGAAPRAPSSASVPALPAATLEELTRMERAAASPAAARPGAEKADAEGAPGGGLQLQAIAERDGRPVAVISGRVVHEGDRYDGLAIVRIGADEVEIEEHGRRRTLRF